MAKLAPRVKETSTTTGTGTFTLAGAVTGFQSFASQFADADQVFYVIVAVNASGIAAGAWEIGIGTVGASGTTLARTSVIASTNANAAVNFAAGTKQVFVDRPAGPALTAGRVPFVDADGLLTDDAGLTYDETEEALTLGVTVPITFHSFINSAWDGEPAAIIGDPAVDECSLLIGKRTDASTRSGALITAIRSAADSAIVEITPYSEDNLFNGSVRLQAGNGTAAFNLSGDGVSSEASLAANNFEVTAPISIGNGFGVRTSQVGGVSNTVVFQAYDENGTAYKTFATLTNGDVPSFTIEQPSGGLLVIKPPTSDPGVPGAIWNNAGTPAFSV